MFKLDHEKDFQEYTVPRRTSYFHVSLTLICKMNFTARVSGEHLCSKYIVSLQIYSQMKTVWITAIYEQDKKLNKKIRYNFLTGKDKNLLGKNSDKWWNDMEVIP